MGYRSSLVLYSAATVGLESALETRRWQSIVAVVAALSLFTALIAGSSLRPQLSASALPEPAAWTHETHSGQAHAGQVRDADHIISHLSHGRSAGSTPTDAKPFHSMWMTRDRPASWPSISPQSGWFLLPTSLAAPCHWPDGAHPAVPLVAPAARDILTMLCVIRR
ncbi:hypothetical protein BST39_07175 [Mycobacterium paraseoulense]|uniref:Uncharacterized protein n=1 Tax=Mycobacterium paraseoulense TaxID=590652 RepID=A0A1X0IDY5_9MYCO|nr:hypothetical protein BST39_07175 [Mycobacterium paraseoulense]